jgi:hypothetical protein
MPASMPEVADVMIQEAFGLAIINDRADAASERSHDHEDERALHAASFHT